MYLACDICSWEPVDTVKLIAFGLQLIESDVECVTTVKPTAAYCYMTEQLRYQTIKGNKLLLSGGVARFSMKGMLYHQCKVTLPEHIPEIHLRDNKLINVKRQYE